MRNNLFVRTYKATGGFRYLSVPSSVCSESREYRLLKSGMRCGAWQERQQRGPVSSMWSRTQRIVALGIWSGQPTMHMRGQCWTICCLVLNAPTVAADGMHLSLSEDIATDPSLHPIGSGIIVWQGALLQSLSLACALWCWRIVRQFKVHALVSYYYQMCSPNHLYILGKPRHSAELCFEPSFG
jgi:hypothetical protein